MRAQKPSTQMCCPARMQGWHYHDADCSIGQESGRFEDEYPTRIAAVTGFLGATMPATLFFAIAIILGELLFAPHINYWAPFVIGWVLTVGMMLARRD